MHARVAKFEGADPDKLRQSIDEIKERSQSGPPEGVPAKRLLVMMNADEGNALVVTIFDSEDDLKQGHETLNSMSPPQDGTGMGERASVELYEVAVELEA